MISIEYKLFPQICDSSWENRIHTFNVSIGAIHDATHTLVCYTVALHCMENTKSTEYHELKEKLLCLK